MLNILENLWKKISNILKEDFLLILGITIFNYLPYGIERYFYGRYIKVSFYKKILKFSFSFLDFFMLILGIALILTFCNKKIKNIVLKILFYIAFPIFIIELFLLKTFRTKINSSVMQILLETNKNEAFEFIETYFGIKQCLIFIFAIFFIIIFIKFSYKKIDIFNRIFKYKILKIIFIIYPIIKIFGITSDLEIFDLERIYSSTKLSMQSIKNYQNITSNLNKNQVKILQNNSQIKNIVFIIGESTARNHMSLYGYKQETNPLLKKIEKEGDLYKFIDVISPHSTTILSLEKALTFYNYESSKEWYTNNNIVDIMKKSGYKTYWFSNQEAFGAFGNVGNVAATIGNRSDITIFNSLLDYADNYDEQIVDIGQKELEKTSNNKNFIVYHILGAHNTYKNRYPKSFDKFETKIHKIGEYDNAILYNDYVINKIISNFKDKEAIIIYMPDHGEEVYDFRDFVGHSNDNVSRYMVEIPFLIYASGKFKEKYPEIVKRIEKSLNNPYMTDDLIHTILDIADIKTPEFDETRSIINEKFNAERKRIYTGKDYDEYWKNRD